MEIKDAVARAKEFVLGLYADEKIVDLGLEEIEFDEVRNCWMVTVGFTRQTTSNALLAQLGGSMRRNYKIVSIADTTGQAISLKDRELSA